MTLDELLTELSEKGVKLWAEGDNLRIRAPKQALTTNHRNLLRTKKKEILSLLRQRKIDARASSVPLVRFPREGNLPLSFAQQRLWFLDQLEPGTPLYNIPLALHLSGPLNVVALERSLNEIIRRHEVLRTAFPTVDGKPQQTIADSLKIKLSTVDLTNIPDGEQANVVNEEVRKYAESPFELAKGSLIRATLIRPEKNTHILVLVMHHIVSDGWSMGVLFRELSTLYEAFTSGKPSPLPELPIQYADFADWQRQWLRGDVLESQLSYWKNHLANLPVLELSTDRPRPSFQTFRGARKSVLLPKKLTDELKALSRQEKVTPFMTLLATFQTLLNRYTGQEDIVIGSPIAGRARAEIKGLIGFFVNTLVLRTDLSGNPSFRELLLRVREVALDAYEHQDVPFEKLVEVLQPKRVPGHNPLFQVMLAFQNFPISTLELSNMTVSPVEIGIETAKFDLSLVISETEEGKMKLRMAYNTDLFESSTIEKMLSNYKDLLTLLLSSPDRQISTLPMFTHKPSKLPEEVVKTDDPALERSNLTRNQLLIWVGQMMNPDAPIYNMGRAFKLCGKIDPQMFQKAFQTILSNSDALRAVIREIEGVPQRVVLDRLRYKLEYIDYSRISEPEVISYELMRERLSQSFDFDKCLFDTFLVKISEEQYVWYLSNHQIILDAWSASLIYRHVLELYQGLVHGKRDYEFSLPLYEEYVKFEHALRNSNRYIESEKFWKQKLSRGIEPLNLYGKNPLNAKQTTLVQRITHKLDPDRSRMLKQAAKEPGIRSLSSQLSLFNIFATILISYLYRISGNRRISLGIPFHNRSSKAFKQTIGLFMEVCPLQIEISEGETFLSLLKKVQAEMFEILNHSQYGTGNPMQQRAYYEVLLNYQVVTFPSLDSLHTETEWLHSGHGSESLALQVHDFSGSGSVVIEFDFHTDLFERQTRSRAIQHFLKTMDSFLSDINKKINMAEIITEEEKLLIREKFNQEKLSYGKGETVIDTFEEQVRETPERVAVTFGDQFLTYEGLNSRADQLASYLNSLGIGPEDIVGLFFEKSLDLIVALLGTLKSGGAYVCFDPTYPKKRLEFMLQDSGAKVILTHEKLLTRLPENEAHLTIIDTDWENIEDHSKSNSSHVVTPNNLAYVNYTSGSTGSPKGSMITHRSLVNAYLGWEHCYSLQSRCSSHLQMAGISFDVFTGDVVRALCSGAKLVICPRETLFSPPELYDLIRNEKIDFAEFVPVVLNSLLEYLEDTSQTIKSFNVLVAGSDSWYRREYRKVQQFFNSDLRIINSYGLTESTIDSTWFEDKHVNSDSDGTVPIGRPFPNVKIYILDSHLQPVPIGVPGELCISGDGLSRGYLNRPDLTAEWFIPNPFTDELGERLFKTGDMARYLPDGNIEFLGRLDNQVKLRGYRIELGEIETALKDCAEVRDAVVVSTEDEPGEQKLVAYIVTHEGEESIINELRGILKERLPEYMLPSAFVIMDSLPLTPNGKIDYRSLPPPDQATPETDVNFVPPGTPTEKTLADIWRKVLEVENVSVYDNFFDVGGHSLQSIQVIASVEKHLGVKLNPRDLMFQTLGQIASLCEERMQTQEDSSKVS